MLSKLNQKIQPFQVVETLRNQGVSLFSTSEFSRLFPVSLRRARYFLETYAKKGILIRLRKNLYTVNAHMPREEVIANALYQPSYLSLEYMLSRYGILMESVYGITSVTPKATATFDVLGKEFSYRKIRQSAYTGYVPETIDGKTVFVAEPEKALADYLYFVSIGRKTLIDRLDCSRLEKGKVSGYLDLFGRQKSATFIEQAFSRSPDTFI